MLGLKLPRDALHVKGQNLTARPACHALTERIPRVQVEYDLFGLGRAHAVSRRQRPAWSPVARFGGYFGGEGAGAESSNEREREDP